MRPDKDLIFWRGETNVLGEGLTLIRCGGHSDGGTVLHWATGAGGRGALLSGDIIQVVAARKHVSFMYSVSVRSRDVSPAWPARCREGSQTRARELCGAHRPFSFAALGAGGYTRPL
jgi:glyoxylase-like metal-dependent hydrolase (beta-lactamase superfamily II)